MDLLPASRGIRVGVGGFDNEPLTSALLSAGALTATEGDPVIVGSWAFPFIDSPTRDGRCRRGGTGSGRF